MIVISSGNGLEGIPVAWAILTAGGTALDAVEAATRVIEDDPDEHTVGLGGLPNLVGDVELDASIMDGTSRRAGAVGALKGYREAISVARAVMEQSPHVFLAGEGAARLASTMGLLQRPLLTPEAERRWRRGLEGQFEEGDTGIEALRRLGALVSDPDHVAGTVNFIARDRQGRIASAVSTSGWAWKHPGRVGDSPVIGAGNYADDRHGAAACTGWGELSIRAGTTRSIVAGLAAGSSIESACLAALADLAQLGDVEPGDIIMHLVALTAGEEAVGYSTRPDRTWALQRDGMSDPELLLCTHVGPNEIASF